MGRKEDIYHYLQSMTIQFFVTKDKLQTDAQSISEALGIVRYNVSRELNKLVEEELAIKIVGRPVFFLSKQEVEDHLNQPIKQLEFENLDAFSDYLVSGQPTISSDYPFSELIGYDGSLSNAVKQAKAALLYPPHGLHTLITGPSGSGKTTFASFMYQYAVHAKTVKSDAPFIVFNCADYSNNQQLLLDQLFGHKKNAFTGANEDKIGVVETADGGILFLDEIHRLPAEGQEMLFSIIDRGEFYRLGETDITRKVNVLIIGATTEDIQGTILSTFLRRIPLVISMPSVKERGINEKIQLVHFSFNQESKKIGKKLIVNEDVIRFFLQYDTIGNIGQLRNDIQLLCANALVESLAKNDPDIHIKLSHLSTYLIDQFYFAHSDTMSENEMKEKLKMLQISDFVFSPDDKERSNPFILVEETSISNDVLDIYEKYLHKEENISSLRELIQGKASQLASNNRKYQQPLFKIVSRKNYEVTMAILKKISDAEDYPLDDSNIKSLALHLDTLIEKIGEGYSFKEASFNEENVYAKNELAREMTIARLIHQEISDQLNIRLPKSEIYFISLYLKAMNERYSEKKIGVLILMHGEQAASDLAKTANQILDVDHAKGLNMPLAQSVGEALEKATALVQQIDQGKGVVLLSDMGSLNLFGDIITKKTGIPTKTIKMVTTPMAIEANRKALLPKMSLERLTQDIVEQSGYIGNSVVEITELEESRTNEIDRKRKIICILEENLNFLDASIVYDLLEKQAMAIGNKFIIDNYPAFWIKYLFHASNLLERAIRKEQFERENVHDIMESNPVLYAFLKKQFDSLENRFAISVNDSEITYIMELVSVNCTGLAH
ncbi:sigma-54-dependent transcriptional regulator [Vagococcus allomyrinae]|nr:sigma 54-interacting transcriptional regulator [Vagococcus allomyrinae]